MASFAQQMKRWAEKTKRTEKAITEAVWLELTRTITFKSPIGDPTLWANAAPASYVPGTFINSWHSTIGASSRAGVNQPDTFAGDTFSGLESIASKVFGNVAYFVNPAAYAFALEYGHSSQAPNGMVRLTARNFRSIVKRAVAKNS